MTFVKVTLLSNQKPFYINLSKVVTVFTVEAHVPPLAHATEVPAHTILYLDGGEDERFRVLETPEQIFHDCPRRT